MPQNDQTMVFVKMFLMVLSSVTVAQPSGFALTASVLKIVTPGTEI